MNDPRNRNPFKPLSQKAAIIEYYTSDQENEENDCDHRDKSFSVDGIYCKDCGETFEDNTGSNLLGG